MVEWLTEQGCTAAEVVAFTDGAGVDEVGKLLLFEPTDTAGLLRLGIGDATFGRVIAAAAVRALALSNSFLAKALELEARPLLVPARATTPGDDGAPTPVAVPMGFMGTFLTGSGGAVHRWESGTEEPLLFKTHGRRLSFEAAKEALKFKAVKKDVTRNLMVDMLVATYNNGADEAMGSLLLQLSVAASCWLPQHGMDVFSGLGLLYSHGTCDKVKEEMAKRYGGAFKTDVMDALILAAEGNEGVGGLSGQIDNYVKGVMARLLKAHGANKTNFKTIATQTRAIGRAHDSSKLRGSPGGYAARFDAQRLKKFIAALDKSKVARSEDGLTPARQTRESRLTPK